MCLFEQRVTNPKNVWDLFVEGSNSILQRYIKYQSCVKDVLTIKAERNTLLPAWV